MVIAPIHFASRLIITSIVLAFCTAIATAADISGEYRADGRNPNGSTYGGRVSISQSGENVAFNWSIGNQKYAGVGTIVGKVVEVDWNNDAPVIYVLRPDGTLHGTWANGTALEKLTPRN